MLKTNSLKSSFCAGLAAVGLLALPAALIAGTETTAKETKVTEAPKTSAITGDFGVNFVSAYFSRGILQENQGAIAEPYADLYLSLFEGSGAINKVSLNMGIWGSIHSHNPGLGTTSSWYEFDWMPGISVTFAKNFTLTTSYYEFDSPNDSFAAARSVNINLAYNDADVLGVFAMHPHITFLRELDNKAGLGARKGSYYEVGIAPGLPAFGPVTVTLPATAGFGSNRFYDKGTVFGYFSVGPNIAIALPFVPSRFGSWTVNTSATYYHLNGNVATADLGRHNDWVFSGGLGMTF